MCSSLTSFSVRFPGGLQGKQRARSTKSGRHYTPRKTVVAEEWIRSCVMEQLGWEANPTVHPVRTRLRIDVAIPASWSKKRQAAALCGDVLPGKKPDLDNVVKLVNDALNGIVWKDDAQIVHSEEYKLYALDACAWLDVEILTDKEI